MAIYVDPLFVWPNKNGQWSHMMTDGETEELHTFAESIGVKRCWYRAKPYPHYDLRPYMRERAVAAGAQEVNKRDLYIKCIRPLRRLENN